jgi:hypothetical protein
LVDALALREKTLVLLAVTTGLRQSELFALKWADVDFIQGTMNVTRSMITKQKPAEVSPINRLPACLSLGVQSISVCPAFVCFSRG